MNKIINIGYGNMVNADKVIGIIKPEAAPVKRLIQSAKDNGNAIDATCGRKTKAVIILENTPRRAAKAVRKAIESAAANLIAAGNIDTKTIAINRISVTAGNRMRRYVPASRGRALPYEKISSNIFVEVCGEEKVKKAAKADDAKKADKKEKESK